MTAALMGRPVREVPREGVLPGWREVAKADIALTGIPTVERILEARLVFADQLRSLPRIAGRGKNIARCTPNVTGFAYL